MKLLEDENKVVLEGEYIKHGEEESRNSQSQTYDPLWNAYLNYERRYYNYSQAAQNSTVPWLGYGKVELGIFNSLFGPNFL